MEYIKRAIEDIVLQSDPKEIQKGILKTRSEMAGCLL